LPAQLGQLLACRFADSRAGMGVVGALEVAPDHVLSSRRALSDVGYGRRPCRAFLNRVERQAAERGRGRVWLVSDGVDHLLLFSELGGEVLLLLDEEILQFGGGLS